MDHGEAASAVERSIVSSGEVKREESSEQVIRDQVIRDQGLGIRFWVIVPRIEKGTNIFHHMWRFHGLFFDKRHIWGKNKVFVSEKRMARRSGE
jgi:hypothetical protein